MVFHNSSDILEGVHNYQLLREESMVKLIQKCSLTCLRLGYRPTAVCLPGDSSQARTRSAWRQAAMRAGHRPPPFASPPQLLCFFGLVHFIRVSWFSVIHVSGGILSCLKLQKFLFILSSGYQDSAEGLAYCLVRFLWYLSYQNRTSCMAFFRTSAVARKLLKVLAHS